MSIARIKTWVAAEVLFASDLNAEFDNLLSNALALISPLTGALNADGQDITAIDELAFTDAAATASAAGRLRRNAGALIWKDAAADPHQLGTNWGQGTSTFGTSADNVFARFAGTAPSTSPADTVQFWTADRNGAGTADARVRTEEGHTCSVLGFTLAGKDDTERTTTSTSTADLSTITVTIPQGDAFYFFGKYRRTTGHASGAALGYKVNGTQIQANFAVTQTTNQIEDGVFFVNPTCFPGATNYTHSLGSAVLQARSFDVGGATHQSYGNNEFANAMPAAAITSITITGQVTNALNTLAIDDVRVYRLGGF